MEERLKICRACPLYTVDGLGEVCDSHKYLGPNDEVSFFKKEGYVKGCNCRLKFKTKNLQNHCPANK